MGRCAFLIVNPVSGGYSEQKLQRVMERLRQHQVSPELLMTGCAEDAALFARRICAEVPAPFLIVGGGDGTINGVLNGLTPGVATIGILPLGTANVLAKELGITSFEDAVLRLERGKTRPFSVGVMDGRGERRYFSLMVGAGFDGAVVKAVRSAEKKVLGKTAYVLAALRTLVAWDRTRLKIDCNGRVVDCHSVIVCNGARYGGSFMLAPDTDIFTSGFQVLCVKDEGRLMYLRLALALVTGKASRQDGVEMISTSEVTISGDKPLQVDGDYHKGDSVTVRSVPDFARIIV